MWTLFRSKKVPGRRHDPFRVVSPALPKETSAAGEQMPSFQPSEGTRSPELERRLARYLRAVFQQLPVLVDKPLRAFCEKQAEVQLQHQAAIDRSVAKIGESLNVLTDAHFEKLSESMAQQLTETLESCVAETLARCTENRLAAMTAALEDTCSAASRRATLGPVIEQIIALHDRSREEQVLLGSWFRRDADMLARLDCRQLFERCDAILGSITAETLMILRTFDVYPLAAGGGVFNPRQQRVVAVELTTNPDLDGQVARVVRLGFMWAGSIHRPEQVVVFKQEAKK